MTSVGRIGIIGGGGWLGNAITNALLTSGTVRPDFLTCSYRSSKPQNAASIRWTNDNGALVERSDVVILCVRPADWQDIDIRATEKLVVSVMAGVTVDDIRKRTGASRLARVLPNAAAELGCSYSPFYLVSDREQDRAAVRLIFQSCGLVDEVQDERHIDYFTGFSGSGAAFPALLAEAMANDAIARGIPQDIAVRAAKQVIIGAGRLQEAHGEAPSETVKAFVDYKGTTAAGIEEMRHHGFESAVRAGLETSYQKARAMASA